MEEGSLQKGCVLVFAYCCMASCIQTVLFAISQFHDQVGVFCSSRQVPLHLSGRLYVFTVPYRSANSEDSLSFISSPNTKPLINTTMLTALNCTNTKDNRAVPKVNRSSASQNANRTRAPCYANSHPYLIIHLYKDAIHHATLVSNCPGQYRRYLKYLSTR
jgi:hypothetical protein